MPEKALKNVAAKYHLTVEQVAEIIALLQSNYSIPYIMRYHKELAASLEPADFYELMDEKQRLDKLEARRRKILKKLAEREILDESLEEKINQARDVRELIDYYVPFRPRKRSQSRQALSQGLEPLAREVLTQERFIPDMGAAAEPFVDPEKGVETSPTATGRGASCARRARSSSPARPARCPAGLPASSGATLTSVRSSASSTPTTC